jgi:glutaconate CoA-transferase subunit A
MAEAITQFVPNGAAVAMGCALESGIPFAAGHELIRQGRRDLVLIGPISDMLFDQLIGAGCVRKVIAAWVGNVGAGLARNFRRAAEEGVPTSLEIEDHSNLTLALSLQAAAWGLPYLPTRSALGTDLLNLNPALQEIRSPFTGEHLVAVRSLHPDVAIIHCQRADASGNGHLWGGLGVVVEAARAARRVILSCEGIVDEAVIRSDPNRTQIPGFLVAAVVEEPWGAHPSPVQGYCKRDDAFFVEYHQQTRTPEAMAAWLNEWVIGPRDRASYVARLGVARVRALQVTADLPAAAVNYAW